MPLTSRQLVRTTTVRNVVDIPSAVDKLAGGWTSSEVKVVTLTVYESSGTTNLVVVFERIG